MALTTVAEESNTQQYGSSEGQQRLGLASRMQQFAGAQKGIGAFATMAGAFTDFQALRFEGTQEALRATQTEIIAEQKANILREKVMGDISSSIATYGARGVSISSGTPVKMTEAAQEAVGQDIRQQGRQAKREASMMRTRQKLLKSASRAALWTGLASGVQQGMGAFATGQGMGA